MKVNIINAECDLGVNVDGASLGPKVLKETIKDNKSINKIIDVTCDCTNKDKEENNLRKNYDRLVEYTTKLYKTIL